MNLADYVSVLHGLTAASEKARKKAIANDDISAIEAAQVEAQRGVDSLCTDLLHSVNATTSALSGMGAENIIPAHLYETSLDTIAKLDFFFGQITASHELLKVIYTNHAQATQSIISASGFLVDLGRKAVTEHPDQANALLATHIYRPLDDLVMNLRNLGPALEGVNPQNEPAEAKSQIIELKNAYHSIASHLPPKHYFRTVLETRLKQNLGLFDKAFVHLREWIDQKLDTHDVDVAQVAEAMRAATEIFGYIAERPERFDSVYKENPEILLEMFQVALYGLDHASKGAFNGMAGKYRAHLGNLDILVNILKGDELGARVNRTGNPALIAAYQRASQIIPDPHVPFAFAKEEDNVVAPYT